VSNVSSLENWFLQHHEQDFITYKLGGFPIEEFDTIREQFKLQIERKGQHQTQLSTWSSAFLQYCAKHYATSQHSYLVQEKPRPQTPQAPPQAESLSKEELKARREVGLEHIKKMKKLFGKR